MIRRSLSRLIAVALVAAGSLLPVTPGHGAAPVAAPPSPDQLDGLLTVARNPARDLYALTERLKLHTTTPIDPYVHARPVDYPLGSTATFYVARSDTQNGFVRRTATLRLKTAHAYYYVEQGSSVDMKGLARAAVTFEQHIYPTDRALFGQEWTPGVDDDRHITIFNGHIPTGDLGYFSAEDLYPRSVNAFSNQRKMIYMNLGLLTPGTAGYSSVLAHEFQHMIHFHLHPADEAWINEGSSILAQVLNGYDDSGYAASKAASPDTQLNTWDPVNYSPYYGGGYLWMLYLYEHFGGARALRTELADRGLSNMALFGDVLARLGAHLTANDLFARWVVANFLNDRAIDGGRYGYTHTSVQAQPTSSATLPFSQHATMHQYAANYIDIPHTGGAAFTLRFAGAPTVRLLGTVPPEQSFWWSNRGDDVDDTLTLPPLDLTRVRHATLRYQAWYDLERDYDYGYVEVSTDGGKTWYAQRTAHTTSTNPNGANLGSGYTGSSCSPASAARHCWVQERIDLSRYAGKRILVRFEQVTDDEVNLQGLAIAHIQVPAIGFDGDATLAGWQPAGWVRAGNTLAEQWLVQAIIYAPRGIRVMRMPVGTDGRGSLRIPRGSTRVVAVVSPAAPLTTITNSYTLSGG